MQILQLGAGELRRPLFARLLAVTRDNYAGRGRGSGGWYNQAEVDSI